MYKSNIVICILFAAVALYATSYSGPVKMKVSSADGSHYAVIDPDKTVQHVYRKEAGSKPLWSFSFAPEMDSWFVADNGRYVACVRWRFVRKEDLGKAAVIVFSSDGKRSEYSYSRISNPRKAGIFETAPKGSFWRVWYESLKTENNRVEIFTHDERRIVIKGDDGGVNVYRD